MHDPQNHHSNPQANAKRSGALQDEFLPAIGLRVLLLTAQFPFLFIGIVRGVVEDFIQLDVQTTHVEQLENRTWYLHVDTINAFYIERPGQPPIPELNG